MLRFACLTCQSPVSAPEDCAGRTTRCPECGHPITVPTPAHYSTPPPQREKIRLGTPDFACADHRDLDPAVIAPNRQAPARRAAAAKAIQVPPPGMSTSGSPANFRRLGPRFAVLLIVFTA